MKRKLGRIFARVQDVVMRVWRRFFPAVSDEPQLPSAKPRPISGHDAVTDAEYEDVTDDSYGLVAPTPKIDVPVLEWASDPQEKLEAEERAQRASALARELETFLDATAPASLPQPTRDDASVRADEERPVPAPLPEASDDELTALTEAFLGSESEPEVSGSEVEPAVELAPEGDGLGADPEVSEGFEAPPDDVRDEQVSAAESAGYGAAEVALEAELESAFVGDDAPASMAEQTAPDTTTDLGAAADGAAGLAQFRTGAESESVSTQSPFAERREASVDEPSAETEQADVGVVADAADGSAIDDDSGRDGGRIDATVFENTVFENTAFEDAAFAELRGPHDELATESVYGASFADEPEARAAAFEPDAEEAESIVAAELDVPLATELTVEVEEAAPTPSVDVELYAAYAGDGEADANEASTADVLRGEAEQVDALRVDAEQVAAEAHAEPPIEPAQAAAAENDADWPSTAESESESRPKSEVDALSVEADADADAAVDAREAGGGEDEALETAAEEVVAAAGDDRELSDDEADFEGIDDAFDAPTDDIAAAEVPWSHFAAVSEAARAEIYDETYDATDAEPAPSSEPSAAEAQPPSGVAPEPLGAPEALATSDAIAGDDVVEASPEPAASDAVAGDDEAEAPAEVVTSDAAQAAETSDAAASAEAAAVEPEPDAGLSDVVAAAAQSLDVSAATDALADIDGAEIEPPPAPEPIRALVQPIEIPSDYVPAAESSHALYQLQLDGFEGPLDLLLHLIKRHHLDIFDIPIAFICEQYLQYLKVMEDLDIDVAAEFLYMATELLQLKSRMLLPKPEGETEEEDEVDPRAELVRRLLEYQKYKDAADKFSSFDRFNRDTFGRDAEDPPPALGEPPLKEVGLFALVKAFESVLKRQKPEVRHQVMIEHVSIRSRIRVLLTHIETHTGDGLRFEDLLSDAQRRIDIVVTFLALLEMGKLKLLRIFQDQDGVIYLSPKFEDVGAAFARLEGLDESQYA